jgi:CheY-like chemotaxis protein
MRRRSRQRTSITTTMPRHAGTRDVLSTAVPTMSGHSALGASRRIGRCLSKRYAVILVSAYHDPDLIARAESDHILAYLVKPIKQAHLEPAIAIAMRRFE